MVSHNLYLFTPNTTAGHYELFKGFYVEAQEKPHWWYRFWTRVLLGWKWIDREPVDR